MWVPANLLAVVAAVPYESNHADSYRQRTGISLYTDRSHTLMRMEVTFSVEALLISFQ